MLVDDDVIEVAEAAAPVEAAVSGSVEGVAPRVHLHRGHQRHRAEGIGDDRQVPVPGVPARVPEVAEGHLARPAGGQHREAGAVQADRRGDHHRVAPGIALVPRVRVVGHVVEANPHRVDVVLGVRVDLRLLEVPGLRGPRGLGWKRVLGPGYPAVGAAVDRVALAPVAAPVAAVEVAVLAAHDVPGQPPALAVRGRAGQLGAPGQPAVLAGSAHRVGVVAVDAEHPGGLVEGGGVGRGGDGLVVLYRPSGGHRGAGPALPLVVRPLDGHPQQRVHVELHDAVRPRVDVHVRVVGVRHRQEGAVDVLARVLAQVGHPDHARAPHDRRGARRPVAPAGHVEVVGRGDPDGRLERGHADPIVGPNSADGRVVPHQHRAPVEHVGGLRGVGRVGVVIPGRVADEAPRPLAQGIEDADLLDDLLLLPEAAREGCR